MLTMIVFAVLAGICLIFTIVGILMLVNDNNSFGGFMFTVWGSALLAVTLIVALTLIPCQHAEALSIHMRIAALERTVEQQTALISSDGTFGQGLEGLEMKRTIQETIRDLNDLIARAEYIEISPWYIFRPRPADVI